MKSLSHVQLFATPWTVAYHTPLSMGFSRQEYWSGLPFPSPEDLTDQGSNLGLPHCRQMVYHLSHQENPFMVCSWHQILNLLCSLDLGKSLSVSVLVSFPCMFLCVVMRWLYRTHMLLPLYG